MSQYGRSPEKVTYEGKQYSVPQLAKILNVSPRTLYYRISMYGPDKAIEVSKMSAAEYKQYRSIVNSKNYRPVKFKPAHEKKENIDIPEHDPDYDLKNTAKNLIERFGFEGAIEKASLRI